ncbi:MAG: hypothetical protein HYW07_15770 [Candidatus Latescibacteria bacterium]|nr:hypothetical protein [Candidatus Latescibacterota bacterium]
MGMCLSLLVFVCALATPSLAGEKVLGITLSTHGSGQDWGSDEIPSTLEDIRQVGANWVAIHPYARISGDGQVRFRDFDPVAPPAYLTRPIQEAHELGLKICIIPHLAYWGSPFSWRGDIGFDQPEQWERFWGDYTYWITRLAAACQGADGFVVGSELDRTLGFEGQWRALIAQVRKRTPAPLSYAANWTDYTRVPFWDALDVVGVQAYFPLVDHLHPTQEEIEAGWALRVGELRTYSQQTGKYILFTELGYNQSYLAPVEPWNYQVDGEGARSIQETCMRTALEVVADESSIVGAFLWKWFPYPRPVGRDFQLATPAIRQIISSIWLRGR